MTGCCVGDACFIFFLWSVEKERGREREKDRQTERRKDFQRIAIRASGWREWQQHHIKRIKRMSYQGKMDQWIHFMQKKTANSRHIEILLWGEKWIIDAAFSFSHRFRFFSCLPSDWFTSVLMIYMWVWELRYRSARIEKHMFYRFWWLIMCIKGKMRQIKRNAHYGWIFCWHTQ